MENSNNFLKNQLKILQDIREGNSTWAELNNFRVLNGLPSISNDSLCRNAKMLGEYSDEGWVKEPEGSTNSNYREIIELTSNGETVSDKLISISKEQLKDPNFLLDAHGFDANLWELKSAKNSFWSGDKVSSRISVKPKNDGLDYKEIAEHFENFAKIYNPKEIIPKQYEYGAEMLVPSLYDIHFGKLGDIDECKEKYDYKIARERFLQSVKKYVNKFKDRKFEKVVFVIGNDFFNSEPTGATINNTRQDNDSRYSKVFNKGIEALIEAIDMFSTIAPTEVVLVQGNHSFYTEFYASCVLKAWYRNSNVVTIDNSPTVRKYIKFGQNLLGFTHGSEEKDRIYGLMQYEAAEYWGSTTTREWIVGHLHSEGVTEKNGVVVRRIPSLTGADFWHSLNGYTTSKKRTMAFIYDKEEGLTETHYVNI